MISKIDGLVIETERAKDIVAAVRYYLLHHDRIPDFQHRDALELAISAHERICYFVEGYKAAGDVKADAFLAAERIMHLLEWLRGRVIAVQGRGRLRLVDADNDEMKKAA